MNYVVMEILRALWVLMPVYTANVLASLRRGRIALDAKAMFMGNRLFGEGKTAEGFFTGFLSGFVVATIQYLIQPYLPMYMNFLDTSAVFCVPFLAVFGDLAGSFVKRRLGMKRGEMALFIDQLDFSIFPLLYLLAAGRIPLVTFLVGLALTMPLHMIINTIAFKLGVKKEPW